VEDRGIRQIVLLCQQPFVAEGLAAVLKNRESYEIKPFDSLAGAQAYLNDARPALVLVYLGTPLSLAELRELFLSTDAPVVLWGGDVRPDFAYQAIQAGVRGILPNTMDVPRVIAALDEICDGGLWVDRSLVDNLLNRQQITLTRREEQLVAHVAQGLKNKEIAFSLGISEGTVKVYLSRLFAKLGVKDRLDLALYGLRNMVSGHSGAQPGGEVRQDLHASGTCRSFLLPGAALERAVKRTDPVGPRRISVV
jgi:two-component system, NarL family, nitrate/nitrite response regulator NarL